MLGNKTLPPLPPPPSSLPPPLPPITVHSLTFTVKKEGFGGGGSRQLQFNNSGQGDVAFVKPSGKTLNITVGPGLPPSTSRRNSTCACVCVCMCMHVRVCTCACACACVSRVRAQWHRVKTEAQCTHTHTPSLPVRSSAFLNVCNVSATHRAVS